MYRAIGLALLVAGIVLIIYGINASDSISSSVSRAVTGSPTNKTLWLLVGGSASAIAGAALSLKPSGKA
jgi:hypothetical protein